MLINFKALEQTLRPIVKRPNVFKVAIVIDKLSGQGGDVRVSTYDDKDNRVSFWRQDAATPAKRGEVKVINETVASMKNKLVINFLGLERILAHLSRRSAALERILILFDLINGVAKINVYRGNKEIQSWAEKASHNSKVIKLR